VRSYLVCFTNNDHLFLASSAECEDLPAGLGYQGFLDRWDGTSRIIGAVIALFPSLSCFAPVFMRHWVRHGTREALP
jgi:hypothetical protein